MKNILGDGIPVDLLKSFLHGADGNVQIAINHFLEHSTKTENQESLNLEKIILELAEEVKCVVCFEYMEEPRTLPCGHSICASCLDNMVNSTFSKNMEIVRCPICMSNHPLPHKWIRNFNLAHITEKLKQIKLSNICAECNDSSCNAYCQACHVFLCTDCHKKVHQDHSLEETSYTLPVNIEKDACMYLFYSWLKTLWFAPSDLMSKMTVQEFKLSYIPYWLFELEGHINYTCLVHFGDPLAGNWRRNGTIEETSIAVCAANNPDKELPEEIGSWKIEQIEQFTRAHKEKADSIVSVAIDEDIAWETKAQKELEEKAKKSCTTRLMKENQKMQITQMKVDMKLRKKGKKRLMVPVYCVKYTYNGETFLFFVNGSTTKVCGTRPKCFVKAFSVAALGIGAAIGLLSNANIKI